MKKQYLVSLSTSDGTIVSMATAAVKSNAILTNLTIDELAGFYYTNKVLWPTLHKNQELSKTNNTLTVDEVIKDEKTLRGVAINLLCIELIEVKNEDDEND